MMILNQRFFKLTSKERLYELDVPIIGLTGGIGTGKSTVSQILRDKNIPLIDADKLVKEIYQKQSFLQFIKNLFPEINSEEIDFVKLRDLVFNSPERKKILEHEIHQELPAVFKKQIISRPAPFYFYDVPLLFERNLESKFDSCVLVYAPKHLQEIRATLRDKNHSPDSIKEIIEHQFDIEIKRNKSDFVIDNSKDIVHLKTEVDRMLNYFFGLTK